MPRTIPTPPFSAAAARLRRPARASVQTAEPPLLVVSRRSNPWLRRGLIFATCVLLLDGLVGDSGLATTMRAREGYAATAAEVQRLREENAGLLEQVRRLQDDPAAIEEVAREELGLIRPGEVVIVVRDPD
jgi:cell division protein FtsB